MYDVFGKTGRKAGGIQPWNDVFTFGKDIRNFYESRGDVTIVGTHEIATLLDGPEKVVRFGRLTVGDGTTLTVLTTTARCKGLTIICDELIVKANATIKMTARGARVDRGDDPRFPFIDFLIPNKIGLYSEAMSRKAALELIAKLGLAPWDRGFWDSDGGLLGLNCSIVEAGATLLLSVAGCGASRAGMLNYTSVNGSAGNAGVDGGVGSGGVGGVHCTGTGQSANSGAGSPYAGGSGSGGAGGGAWSATAPCPGVPVFSGPGGPGGMAWTNAAITADQYPGYSGGGAGNPGGKPGSMGGGSTGTSGCGGKLVIICYGNITVESGGKIESNGSAGGAGSSPGSCGGGSGGGHISIIHAGTYTNSGTVQCAGGAGGTGGVTSGGAGGAGSVVTKTFAQMGWS